MSSKTTDTQIIGRALELFRAGFLASAIPARLMADFGLTPERARELSAAALKRHKQQGKLKTKPLDQEQG